MLRTKRDPKKALVYIRVSSEKQAKSGLGLESQEQRCRTYCNLYGLKIAGIFREEGVSASKPLGKRPEGTKLLDHLEHSDIGAVVILKLDRAFRSASDALVTIEGWNKLGVALHMVDFGGSAVDTSSAAGKLFVTMMAGFAEFERSLISDRTKSALTVKKERGEVTGHIPYGHQLAEDGKTLVVNPNEQGMIELILAYHSAGNSVRKVSTIMNTSGHKNRGGVWTKSAVHRIVTKKMKNFENRGCIQG